MTTTYTNELAIGTMRSVAYRIAQMRKVDMAAAKKDEKQAISCMTEDEAVEFVETIIRYAIEIG